MTNKTPNSAVLEMVDMVHLPQGKKPIYLRLAFVPGLRVEDFLLKSGLLEQNPELRDLAVGIFGKVVSKDTLVRAGDRIEFYRPLLMDPKEKRRRKAVRMKRAAS